MTQIKHSCTILFVASAVSLVGCSKTPSQPAQDVPGLVKMLSSNDVPRQQEALGALASLPPDEFGEIQNEANLNLPGSAGKLLQQLIHRLQPLIPARQRLWNRTNEEAQHYTNTLLNQYQQFGRHDEKWDTLVGQFLRTYASRPYTKDAQLRRQAQVKEQLAEIQKTHCTDPFIRYMLAYEEAKKVPETGDRNRVIQNFQFAIDDLQQSSYPIMRKCFAHARFVEYVLGQNRAYFGQQKSILLKELNLALQQWPQALRETELTNWETYELADAMGKAWYRLTWDGKQWGDRGKVYDYVVAPWQAARPDDVGPLVFTGILYTDYAWDARGGDYANKVTSKGWQLMADRLKIARAALEKAYAKDPDDARAPTQMITVIMGQQTGRDDMEKWFARAMKANPDDMDACDRKLTFLEPKWGGTPEDMIDFGRQCFQGGDFEGRIPFVLVDAYHQLASYYADPRQLYSSQGVWDDIRSVYEKDLALYPDSPRDRSFYAYYAVMCGQLPTARQQFKILGDHPNLDAFETMQKYDQMREQAGVQVGR